MRLRAVDADGVRATVANWTFDVKEPPAFGLSYRSGWSPAVDGALATKYVTRTRSNRYDCLLGARSSSVTARWVCVFTPDLARAVLATRGTGSQTTRH